MRVGIVLNRVGDLHPEQTTAMLAARAVARDHETWLVEVAELGQDAAGPVIARGRRAGPPSSLGGLVSVGPVEPLVLDDLDAVLIRTNPARDPLRPWAHQAALLLLEVLRERGVPVHNDPRGLVWASSKLHLTTLPESVRPRTLVTRDPERIEAFLASAPGDVVLKPISGTRGQDVFRIDRDRRENLPQILDVLVRSGLAMAQDYVPEARDGDVRLILLDGVLLEVGGQVAAVRRVPPKADFRSNVAIGGRPAPVEQVTAGMRRVVEEVGPGLVRDGLRLVGLDLVGDRVVEANVYSPGGLFDAERYYGVDFTGAILDRLLSA